MTNHVRVGIWDRAPFRGSISSSLVNLNEFLIASNYDTKYEMMSIKYKEDGDFEMDTLPDVFILDGGEDVNPERYGQANTHSYFSDRRDDVEFGFARFMNSNRVRLSGICRGHQLLNVFYGGSLHQDIRAEGCYTDGLKHTGGHKVKTMAVPRTSKLVLKDFVGIHPFTVSSLHHQAVNKIAHKFFISLTWEVRKKSNRRVHDYYSTERGYVIEGIESMDGRIRGLQCHPEFKGYPKDGLMFAYLMHVDNFIQDLSAPSDDELEAKFDYLIKTKGTINAKERGPYKVNKKGSGVMQSLRRQAGEARPSIYEEATGRFRRDMGERVEDE